MAKELLTRAGKHLKRIRAGPVSFIVAPHVNSCVVAISSRILLEVDVKLINGFDSNGVVKLRLTFSVMIF